MSEPIVVPPLAGRFVGPGTADGIVVAEWEDEGGRPPEPPYLIAPPHVHHKDDEAWYVLEGTLGVQVGAGEVVAGPGACVFAPAGTPHTYWNAGAGRLRYLLIMTARIHRLIESIHAAEDRTPAAMAQLFAAHEAALVEIPGLRGRF